MFRLTIQASICDVIVVPYAETTSGYYFIWDSDKESHYRIEAV